MANLNSVMLIGRLTRDPELRSTPSGAQVCNFGLATNEVYKKPDGERAEKTCFVDIEAWNRQAEVCAQYLKKGREIFIAGRLKFDSWEDKNGGGRRSKLKVTARQIQFLGGKRNGNSDGATDAPRPGEPVEAEPHDEEVEF